MNRVMEWKKETGSGTTGKEPGDGDGGEDEEALPKFRSSATQIPTHVSSTIGHRYSVTGRNPEWTAALRALIPDNPDIQTIAAQLLGDEESFVGNFDGNGPEDQESGIVYCTLPNGDAPGEAFPGAERHGEGGEGTLEKHQRAHFDGGRDERARLNVTCYIDAVEPRGGGFLLWPRSHSRMHKRIWSRDAAAHRFDIESEGPIHP